MMIEIGSQLRYFLPHVLAVSTASSFWQGRNTGLKSYCNVVLEMVPRTGIPGSFHSFSEYQAFVDLLGQAGVITGCGSLPLTRLIASAGCSIETDDHTILIDPYFTRNEKDVPKQLMIPLDFQNADFIFVSDG